MSRDQSPEAVPRDQPAVFDKPGHRKRQKSRVASGVFRGLDKESLEVRLFAWDELPWDELAFPSVHWSLQHFRDWQRTGDERTRGTPEGASPGRPQGL